MAPGRRQPYRGAQRLPRRASWCFFEWSLAREELSSLVHRVSAAGHARAERPVIAGAPLALDALLLCHVGALLKSLLLYPSPPPHTAEEGARAGANSCALARVPTDGIADGPQGCATRGSAEHSALRQPHLRRRRGWGWRISRIEAALLDGPGVTLAPVRLLLLRILALVWINEWLSARRALVRIRGCSGAFIRTSRGRPVWSRGHGSVGCPSHRLIRVCHRLIWLL